eukprot:g4721.t1
MFVKTPSRPTPHRGRTPAQSASLRKYSQVRRTPAQSASLHSRSQVMRRTPAQSASLRSDSQMRRTPQLFSLSKRARVEDQVRCLHSDGASVLEVRGFFPRLLTESLSSSSTFSASVSPTGWAYGIVNGQIFVWDCSPAMDTEVGSILQRPDCFVRDFPAPALDRIAPEQVALFESKFSSIGMLAVSSTGAVRCWPELSNQAGCVTLQIPLEKEQNISHVVALPPSKSQKFVCSTSTNNLCMLTLKRNVNGNGYEIQFHRMDPNSATLQWVEGLVGNKMTGILGALGGALTGVMTPSRSKGSTTKTAATGSSLTTTYRLVPKSDVLYVLCGGNDETYLQRWVVKEEEGGLQDLQWPVGQEVRSRVEQSYGVDQLEVKILDIISLSNLNNHDKFLVLAVAHPRDTFEQARYSVHTVDSRGNNGVPCLGASMTLPSPSVDVKHNPYSARLCPNSSNGTAFVWWPEIGQVVAVVIDTESTSEPSSTKLACPARILAAGVVAGSRGLLVLCEKVGLLRFTAKIHEDRIESTQNEASRPTSELLRSTTATTATTIDNIKVLIQKTVRNASRVRQEYERNNSRSAELPTHILEPLQPLARESARKEGTKRMLCAAVQSISKAILDQEADVGRNWQDYDSAAPGSRPLLVQYQLEHKHRQHSDLLHVLRSAALWRSIGTATRAVLAQHGALLYGATSLSRYQNEHIAKGGTYRVCIQVLHEAMQETCRRYGVLSEQEMRRTGLTVQDIFYSYVTMLPELLGPLLSAQRRMMQTTARTPMDHESLITFVNGIFSCVLFETSQHQEQTAARYFDGAFAHSSERFGLVTLLTTGGTRENLQRQMDITVEAVSENSKLLDQLASLGGLLLRSFREELKEKANGGSLHEQYVIWKKRIIDPLEREGFRSAAIDLAEENAYLELLVRLFWKDSSRMQMYTSRFPSFAKFSFQWLLNSSKEGANDGKLTALINQPPSQHDALTSFLSDYPRLEWLHAVQTSSHFKCAKTLLSVAATEKKSIRSQKTMLSIAKLSLLASREKENTMEYNTGNMDEEQDMLLRLADTQLNLVDAQVDLLPQSTEKEKEEMSHRDGVPLVPEETFVLHLLRVEKGLRHGGEYLQIMKSLVQALRVIEAATNSNSWRFSNRTSPGENGSHDLCLAAAWRCVARVDAEKWNTWVQQRRSNTISDEQLGELFRSTALARATTYFSTGCAAFQRKHLVAIQFDDNNFLRDLSPQLIDPLPVEEADLITMASETLLEGRR